GSSRRLLRRPRTKPTPAATTAATPALTRLSTIIETMGASVARRSSLTPHVPCPDKEVEHEQEPGDEVLPGGRRTGARQPPRSDVRRDVACDRHTERAPPGGPGGATDAALVPEGAAAAGGRGDRAAEGLEGGRRDPAGRL